MNTQDNIPPWDGTEPPKFVGSKAKIERMAWIKAHGIAPSLTSYRSGSKIPKIAADPVEASPPETPVKAQGHIPVADFDLAATAHGRQPAGMPNMNVFPTPVSPITERGPDGRIIASSGRSLPPGAKAAGRELFSPYVHEAVSKVIEIMRSPNQKLALQAATRCLEYVVGKPVIQVDATTTSVKVDIDDLLVAPGGVGAGPTVVATDEEALAASLDSIAEAIAERRAALARGPVLDLTVAEAAAPEATAGAEEDPM